MNGLDFGTAIGLIKGLGSPDPAVIESAVSDWLDDHPEATTTVQDGSITKAKLDSNLQGTVDDVADLKSQFDEITPWAFREKFNGTYTNLYRHTSGVLSANDNVKSAMISAQSGKKYTITATGNFNRFAIYGCEGSTAGSVATTEYFESGTFSHKEYEYINTNGYPYLCILVSYGTASFSCDLSVIEVSGTVSDVFSVNGVAVPTDEQFEHELDTAITGITGGDYERSLTPTITNYSLNHGVITTTPAGKLAYVEMQNGLTYKVNVNGTFNRFAVCTSSSVAIGSTCTVQYSETITHGDHDISYDYVNAENAKYLVVFYNYDDAGISDATITVTEINFDGNLTLNGIKIYTANQVDDLINPIDLSLYLHYVSSQSVTLAADANAVYALYDALVTEYPDYITRSTLGTDSGNNTVYGYQFGSGAYNSAGLRGRDAEKAKPTILLVAGVHGYERTAVMSLYQFLSDLCAGNHYLADLQNNYIFKVIPMVCPYAFNANTRVNANGVNINRNFDANWQSGGSGTQDYSGESAADQPETQIVQGWINDNTGAILYIDFHNSGYTNEVSYIAGANSVDDMAITKQKYLVSGYCLIPYFEKVEGFASDLIYAYTGDFATTGMSYQYAQSKDILALTLETSWQQNGSAMHSVVSNRAGAIVLGNLLNSFINRTL